MWYLIAVVVSSAAGITLVVWRQRPRGSIDSSIRDFERGLDALAPPHGVSQGSRPRVTD